MMKVPIIWKPVITCKLIDWFLYDTGLRHGRIEKIVQIVLRSNFFMNFEVLYEYYLKRYR